MGGSPKPGGQTTNIWGLGDAGTCLYPGRRAEERLRALPAGHRVHRTGNDQAHRGGEGTALGVHRQWRLRRHRAHGDQGRAGPAARRPRRRRHAQVRLSLQRPAEDLLRRRVRSQRRPPRRCPALSQQSRRPRHEVGPQPAAVAHRLPDQPKRLPNSAQGRPACSSSTCTHRGTTWVSPTCARKARAGRRSPPAATRPRRASGPSTATATSWA